MSTPGHIASASIISLMAAKVSPSQTGLILTAIIFAGIVDFDHLIMIFKNRSTFKKHGYRGTLHHARSIFHELFGVLCIGIISLIFNYFVGYQAALVIFLSFVIHLSQDFILGKSFPFSPIDKTEMQLFHPTFKKKILIEFLVIIISGLAWVKYLTV